MKFSKENIFLIFIILIGLLLRLYKPLELFMYAHDQDLAGWIVKDILFEKHFRLIGQETSIQGVFIGPLFYYLLVPFYLLTRMNPVAEIFLSIIIGTLAIYSFYWVFRKIFNKGVGLIGSFIYAVSFLAVFTDRDIAPTTPVMLWSVWYLYSIYLILKGKQKPGFILAGLLMGLVWNFNLALLIISPLVLISFLLSKSGLKLKYVLMGVGILFFTSLPLVTFELKHGFIQTRAIVASLTTDKTYISQTGKGFAKLDRVLQLSYKNTRDLFLGPMRRVPTGFTFYTLILIFVFLSVKKIISRDTALLMLVWQATYLTFFTLNSINVSEYYLNGMNVIWILIFSLGIEYLFRENKFRKIGAFALIVFFIINVYRILRVVVNKSGYVERRAIVKEIKEDSLKHNYPCVSVSYITDPGYNLGYRYLFWLEKMHVNQPKSQSPVYSIVFPHSKVDRIDKSFGALGLIYPDYRKYSDTKVKESCQGENSNLTDPMFGFTN